MKKSPSNDQNQAGLQPSEIAGFAILSDEQVGTGGFLSIRRLRLCNRRQDGSLSRPYLCDFVERPVGVDAVCVAVYARTPEGDVQVLLRQGLRPALWFGRQSTRLPIPEPAPTFSSWEIIAGIIEAD